jgi:acetate kinase
MRILVLNPGSSSLKASLIDEPGNDTLGRFERDWGSDATRHPDLENDLQAVVRELGAARSSVDAVGYRVVHGGDRFLDATVLDDAVLAAIRELDALAPLHNAVAADTIAAGRRLLGGVPHVACFDTAFHSGLPETARRYPLPEAWYADWGIRRYGFHGLSVSWSVGRAAAGIAAGATALERFEALVFTGGIGEHSHRMRKRICQRLGVIGVPQPLEPATGADEVIGMLGGLAVLRISAREDLWIARQVARLQLPN